MSQDFYFGMTAGAIGGVLFMFLVTMALLNLAERPLEECAKTNNVYQCEMVAVPKIGEVK